MTYEEVVLKFREGFEDADARNIFEHIAVQVNVTGEGSGAFYIEVADRSIIVEPYDYWDRDGLFTADSAVILDVADGKLALRDAVDQGLLDVNGNMDKINLLLDIKSVKAKKAKKSNK